MSDVFLTRFKNEFHLSRPSDCVESHLLEVRTKDSCSSESQFYLVRPELSCGNTSLDHFGESCLYAASAAQCRLVSTLKLLTPEKASTVDTGYTTVGSALRLPKRAHSCHVNIDTRRFGHIKVDLQISADASEPVLGTSFGCAQVSVDFWSLKMFKSRQTVYS